MSFSSSWLALREPADLKARAPELLQVLEGFFSSRDYADIVDLGSGTGSTLRALQDILPKRQSWRLIDNDPDLLAAAGDELAAWADSAGVHGDALLLEKAGRSIRVRFIEADLAADPTPWEAPHPDLVTASALFDLVSAEWIDRFAKAVVTARVPVYASLNYDGRAIWEPAHPADEDILGCFNRHQGSDKGFGPASGPQAAERLTSRLSAQGFHVKTASSPWLLTDDARPLADELNRGVANAIHEIGEIDGSVVEDWLQARLQGDETRIGHTDVLGLPG
ncbi:trans-aconitate methyltransferase [Agaricicola taiwanensis]|uniref:Trans-aconitate methyltransferase n=1 Tax=Agaricicola taiwanensis TaxID=591372 RepID=A0A8J2VRG7_9RHOB|nr:class I SAM-dependent methyltransferase [Agaricicola taiwanensis]GGE37815.1 trans-aconitate methyltransferase [Agaricicola taiwanensis]